MLLAFTTLYIFSLVSDFTNPLCHSTMSRRKCGTPCHGRQGRGAQLECQIPLLAQESGEGFDVEIPDVVRLIVNDWEDKLFGAANAAG